jgi:hypothetical protein
MLDAVNAAIEIICGRIGCWAMLPDSMIETFW